LANLFGVELPKIPATGIVGAYGRLVHVALGSGALEASASLLGILYEKGARAAAVASPSSISASISAPHRSVDHRPAADSRRSTTASGSPQSEWRSGWRSAKPIAAQCYRLGSRDRRGIGGVLLTTGKAVPALLVVGIMAVFAVSELLLSPIGLSVTTKLAPEAFRAQMMALYFFSVGPGTAMSGVLAR
jgi:dipeptide/tripeptide permease